jgi:hypothetical protein
MNCLEKVYISVASARLFSQIVDLIITNTREDVCHKIYKTLSPSATLAVIDNARCLAHFSCYFSPARILSSICLRFGVQ